jgi:hypothetical protein
MTNTILDHRATPLPPGTEAPEFQLHSTPDQTSRLEVQRRGTGTAPNAGIRAGAVRRSSGQRVMSSHRWNETQEARK